MESYQSIPNANGRLKFGSDPRSDLRYPPTLQGKQDHLRPLAHPPQRLARHALELPHFRFRCFSCVHVPPRLPILPQPLAETNL